MKLCVAVACAFALLLPLRALAWGLEGHRIIGEVAMQNLPAELPPFLQTQAAKDEITYLGSEEDRLKIGGEEAAWAREWPTDHYLDVEDDGTVAGVVALSALPATRDDFAELLVNSPRHIDAYNVGFLPYAILEGYEQVRSDFALWRQAVADAQAHGGDAANTIVNYRETLTIHDIGIFSHFVGDGSQPLHVTVHYNRSGHLSKSAQFLDRSQDACRVRERFRLALRQRRDRKSIFSYADRTHRGAASGYRALSLRHQCSSRAVLRAEGASGLRPWRRGIVGAQ